MIVTVDQKRRVVLPKPVQPGDALEVAATGDVIVLHILKKPTSLLPPIAPKSGKNPKLAGIDLDEPAFLPLADESLA
jgi:bifunctional DNA-binding transcriptional regulator/antitoxin component of YhaV-PrlF toxin-antitoxin module